MSENIDNLKNGVSIVAPFLKPLLELWVKPKIQKFLESQTTDKLLIEHTFCNKFEDYLARSFNKYCYMNTVVFQNQQIKIDDLYIPLTIKSIKDKKQFKLNAYDDNLIPVYKKVLITDTAGMGKSTLMKWLFLSCLKQNKGIPIFIELRRLDEKSNIIDLIFKELTPLKGEYNRDFILQLLLRGDFIFFLDGFDEIPFKVREAVNQELKDFIAKAENNLFVMSSRPESALSSYGDFQGFTINNLTIEEAHNLLRKYDQKGERADVLINKIKEPETLNNLREFLVNPLLVSLLFKAYDHKPYIPYNRRVFYRQVYDALYENHDFTKGYFVREKNSSLDIDKFHMILRGLGYFTFKEGKVEFLKDDLIKLIRKSKEYYPGVDFADSKFLQDLIVTVPLFNRDGDYYKWSHKSIQEYFAAEFICSDAKGKQEKILLALHQSKDVSKYINILELCYDIDYKTFRKTVIFTLLKDFIDYCENSYLEQKKLGVPLEDIQARQGITYLRKYFFFTISLDGANVDETYRNPNSKIFSKTSEQIGEGMDKFSISPCTWNAVGLLKNNKDKAIICGKNSGILRPIIPLLEKRKENLFIDKSKYIDSDLDLDVSFDTPILLDDSPDSLFNTSSMFAKTNSVICKTHNHDSLGLDFKKCSIMKERIENEIAKEASENYLIGEL